MAVNEALPENTILAMQAIGLKCEIISAEPESKAYSAFNMLVDDRPAKFRAAKVTPTKNGQFVTLWKRNEQGETAPFDLTDGIALVIISVSNAGQTGQFVFSRDVLIEKGIFSTPAKEGKRAIRVYPPWDVPVSKQAATTQRWQLDFFVEITGNHFKDPDCATKLYSPIQPI